MESLQISPSITVDVETEKNEAYPITIDMGNDYINLNFDELERIYLFAKGLLK